MSRKNLDLYPSSPSMTLKGQSAASLTVQREVPPNSDIDTSERLETQKGTHLAGIDPFCGNQGRDVQRFRESETLVAVFW